MKEFAIILKTISVRFRPFHILFGILAGIWTVSGLPAEEFKQNKKLDLQAITKAADNGDPIAMTSIGMRMLVGEDVTKDPAKGLAYLEKAAALKEMTACIFLGQHYKSNGNYPLYERYATEAATLGNVSSMLALSSEYFSGNKLKKDTTKSFYWASKAAPSGNPYAAGMVSSLYYSGIGTVKNPQLALLWGYIATAQGITTAEIGSIIQDLEIQLGPKASAQIRDEARKTLANINGRTPPKDREIPNTSETNNTPKQYGTGFAVSKIGQVVTAAHVVKGASKVEVLAKGKLFKARVIQIDPLNDLAVLQVEGMELPALPLRQSTDVMVGQSVFTVGFPNIELQGSNPKMTKGDISSLTGLQDSPTCWQISVPIQTGNSGGPLIDDDGNVIGVIVSRLNSCQDGSGNTVATQNVNYAVKSAYLLPMLSGLDIKTLSNKKKWFFRTFESVVQDAERSVVMILVY